MKAVIYARYSSDNQREESIENQIRICKEYADCIFRLIRTVNPDLSGHGTGNIRTVIRRHPDTCRAI